MRGLLTQPAALASIATASLPVSYYHLPSVSDLKTISEPKGLLQLQFGPFEINGQLIWITPADLLPIVGGIVGVLALAFSIYKHFRPKGD